MNTNDPRFAELTEWFADNNRQYYFEQICELSPLEAEYVLWLYKRHKVLNSKTMGYLGLTEFYLRIALYPISLIIRRDIPSLEDFLSRRIQKKTEEGKHEWHKSLFGEQMTKCKAILNYWVDAILLEGVRQTLEGKNTDADASRLENQFLALLELKVMK